MNKAPTQQEVEEDFSASMDATYGKAQRVNRYSTSADTRAIMCLTSTFTFGKYKGKKTLADVIATDPTYIQWCARVEAIKISPLAYDQWQDEGHPALPDSILPNDSEGL